MSSLCHVETNNSPNPTDNNKRYGSASSSHAQHTTHRRTGSVSQHIEGLLPGPELPMVRPVGTPNVVEADVFPPLRAQAQESIFLPYIAEDVAFEEEYEEYLNDLGISTDIPSSEGAHGVHSSAWSRLEEYGAHVADGISDTESVVSIGELGEERLDVQGDDDRTAAEDENVNNWEVRHPVLIAPTPR
jgi:hypothetical protein